MSDAESCEFGDDCPACLMDDAARDERAAIVRWLRAPASDLFPAVCAALADCIERGTHHEEDPRLLTEIEDAAP